jgi:hypothetical protein
MEDGVVLWGLGVLMLTSMSFSLFFQKYFFRKKK